MPTEQQVTFEQFRQHLSDVLVDRHVDEVIVHHTWKPTAADYRGIETVRGVRRYHMQVRGWSDNGYHVMIGPSGEVFLCRPLRRAGAHVRGRNAHSIGVSFIANFDHEEPDEYAGLATGYRVVAALLERFDLPLSAIRFHREFASKTCPGMKLFLTKFRHRVGEAQSGLGGINGEDAGTGARLKVVLLPGNELIECSARLENGVTRCDLRPLAEALGYEVHDHISDQGKVYLTAGP